MKPTATLRNWYIKADVRDGYYLRGNVYGHARPDLNDGELIYTYRLLRIDFEKNEAETLNTIYTLEP